MNTRSLDCGRPFPSPFLAPPVGDGLATRTAGCGRASSGAAATLPYTWAMVAAGLPLSKWTLFMALSRLAICTGRSCGLSAV